jgi:hypothetical protein
MLRLRIGCTTLNRQFNPLPPSIDDGMIEFMRMLLAYAHQII